MSAAVTAALKGLVKVLSMLISKEDIGKIAVVVLMLPFILGALIFSVPFTIFSYVPAADDEQLEFYEQATKTINKEKGIDIRFMDVVALDAVLLNQEFEKSNYNRALELAKKFIGTRQVEVKEEYETTCYKTDPKEPKKKTAYTCTKTRTVMKTEYFAKTLDDVLSEYLASKKITEEDVEAAKRYANTPTDELDSPTSPVQEDLPTVTDGLFMKPTKGTLTSGFGKRWGTLHSGVDIAQGGLVPVVAAADGVVSKSYLSTSYGNCVFILHNLEGRTYETIYAHMRNRAVGEGDRVKKGQFIGYMGNTGQSYGQHLHFEIHVGRWNMSKSNAVNPLMFINP